jgi:hypothetical protein
MASRTILDLSRGLNPTAKHGLMVWTIRVCNLSIIIIVLGLTGELGWLGLTQYYATAFKTGQLPTIEKDQIVMWSRPHSTSAKAPDPVPPPSNFQLVCHSPVFLSLY